MIDNTLVSLRLKKAKKKLMDLWDSKGMTDQEVLAAAEEVDKWLNEYNRLPKKQLILSLKCLQIKAF